MENNDNSIDLQTVKYLIHIKFVIAGTAEKSDIIGAIFGQTEGLLGDSMDLRELQKTSRIGRIVVKLQYNKAQRKSMGYVIIPSSLDRVETSILAASLETVDRVGPCLAKIQLHKIEDVRSTKRNQIIDRATQILKTWDVEVAPESQNLVEEVVKQARMSSISKWGGLPSGPAVSDSDTVIICEGRADVLNLLKFGFKNAIAIQGTHVPKSIIPLTQKKRTVAFLDGDRGGDLILKELIELAEIDYVARAPRGREVEDLSGKEILKALRNKVSIEQVLKELEGEIDEKGHERPEKEHHRKQKRSKRDKDRHHESENIETEDEEEEEDYGVGIRSSDSLSDLLIKAEDTEYEEEEIEDEESSEETTDFEISKEPELPEEIVALSDTLGSFEAILVSTENTLVKRLPVKDLRDALSEIEPDSEPGVKGVVFDGIITQRLLDVAIDKKLSFIAGARLAEGVKINAEILIYELSD